MRKFILQRIQEIKDKENGFSKSTMKWANFEVTNMVESDNSGKMIHISEMPFDNHKAMEVVSDERLVKIFERIVRQYQKYY